MASAIRDCSRRATTKRSIARGTSYRLKPYRLVFNGGERRRSSPMPPHHTDHPCGAIPGCSLVSAYFYPRYLPEASWSKNRSYMTLPTFHLARLLDVAYGECR